MASFLKTLRVFWTVGILATIIGCAGGGDDPAGNAVDDGLFVSVPADEIVDYDPNDDIIALTAMTEEFADKARAALRNKPADLQSRVRLMAYLNLNRFSSEASAFELSKHSLWVAQNAPGSTAAGSPFTQTDRYSPGYDDIREAWEENVRSHPKDYMILKNAASYFTVYDREFSRRCLEAGREAFPDDFGWHLGLAHLHSLDIDGPEGSRERSEAGQKAYAAQARAIELLKSRDGFTDSFEEADCLAELALYAYESNDLGRAEELCDLVIAKAKSAKDELADEYHNAHQVLGRIALRRGDVNGAGRHLIESANVPGSPVLRSFGPRLRLARMVAAAGNKQSVITYLTNCSEFVDKPEYNDWIQELRDGKLTSIPGTYD